MLVSLKWLKDYVEIEMSAEELAHRLTMAGLEVESISEKKQAFSGVLVGQIVTISEHPQADHLSVCVVSVGEDRVQVVCGARNIYEGALVPLAPVGAMLGSASIEKTLIRAVESDGMLCSEAELGIGDDHSGIFILDAGLTLGMPLTEALDLEDTALEISVTPNRSDCLSLIGIAREVAALTGKTMSYPVTALGEEGPDINLFASVTIDDPELCPRYTARLIDGVKVGPSPYWLRKRLAAVGLRPINNVVDATNYVMMELGQPLHAFDHKQLSGGRIVVRGAKEGELFLTLDGKERILKADTLMICDAEKPVAIAGIMGGMNSEVQDGTASILLESAYFNPRSIRRSAKWLGMTSDASFRFERGIDPLGVAFALDRAAQMIADLAGGKVCHGLIDRYPREISRVVNIPLRERRVNEFLGTKLTGDEIVSTLKSLEMEVSPRDVEDGCYRVTPPSARVDITREVDLIEEIARIYGYDKIGTTLPNVYSLTVKGSKEGRVTEIIRDVLTGYGYSEVINYSFVPDKFSELLSLPVDDPRRNLVRISNPLTDEQSVMRTAIAYSLLENLRRNMNAGCSQLRIFETGRVFFRVGAGQLPGERNHLAALLTGRRYEDALGSPAINADFYDLKGCLESLLEALKLPGVNFRAVGDEPFLHPGRSAHVYIGDDRVGYLGEVSPDVLAAFDIKNRSIVFEVDLDKLAGLYTGLVSYREISRFPASVRDAAFIVPEKTEADSLLAIVSSAKQILLEDVRVFDLYNGPGLPLETKSLGLRFSYRSHDRTLTDEEVNEFHGDIVKQIMDNTGARLRA